MATPAQKRPGGGEAGPGGVGRRGEATQADATPFAAAERGSRLDSEGLGRETLPRTRAGLLRLFCTAAPRVFSRAPWRSRRRCRRRHHRQDRSGKSREAVVTAMPKNKGNCRLDPGTLTPLAPISRRCWCFGTAQAAVTFFSTLPVGGWAVRTRFWARERSWEVTPVFQFGHTGVEPTPFL